MSERCDVTRVRFDLILQIFFFKYKINNDTPSQNQLDGITMDNQMKEQWVGDKSYCDPQRYPFSAGTVFIRQNLTSVDVRF